MKKIILFLSVSLFALSLVAQTNFRDITYKEDIAAAKAEKKLVFIDFYTSWCGPCKKIAPDVEALAEEYKDQVIIGKCDVDDNDELTGRFGVRNIPTVLFIKDGEVKDKTVGAVTKAQLEEKVKALL
ncbi:MAG: thioredoxin [Bacteroidaceae bacterium]|nr:thioredoxin [Bacteroidaceae bacterium]